MSKRSRAMKKKWPWFLLAAGASVAFGAVTGGLGFLVLGPVILLARYAHISSVEKKEQPPQALSRSQKMNKVSKWGAVVTGALIVGLIAGTVLTGGIGLAAVVVVVGLAVGLRAAHIKHVQMAEKKEREKRFSPEEPGTDTHKPTKDVKAGASAGVRAVSKSADAVKAPTSTSTTRTHTSSAASALKKFPASKDKSGGDKSIELTDLSHKKTPSSP